MLGAWCSSVFATGLPSSEKLLAYQPPLPTNVRGYDGNPVQTFARERRVELAYDEYPPLVVNAFISAEDKTFFSHGGIDYPGLIGRCSTIRRKSVRRAAREGGSTITQQVAKYLLQDDEYAVSRKIRGDDPRLPARRHAEQAADPRALPQLDFPRPERLWRAGGEPRLFRQGRRRPDACRRPPISRCCPRRRATTTRCAPPSARSARRNYVLREMAKNGYITERAARRCRRRRSARSATAAAPSSAIRAAISWKRCAAT